MINKLIKNWLQPKKTLNKLIREYKFLWKSHEDILKLNKELQSENRKLYTNCENIILIINKKDDLIRSLEKQILITVAAVGCDNENEFLKKTENTK